MGNGFKFWSLAVIVALIAGFTSCKKDEDNKEKEPGIEGRWQLDQTVYPELGECELKSYREFLNGGKYRALDVCNDNSITDGTWTKNGDKLTIKFDNGDPDAAYSIVLTEDNLKLSITVEGTVVFNKTYVRVYVK
ncbi:MAG: lipocalin family protein [Prevotellaceae bacterium]|jgi:hypothetical protein|nr:lipocalin family protein [Prevotellaceae bacterium]